MPSVAPTPGILRAGVARIDATPPVGLPLAGYGGGARRRPIPVVCPGSPASLFTPSTGVKDPLYIKALVLSDGPTTVAILTQDAIGTDRELFELAYAQAAARGLPIPLDNILVCASHTHSGPGGLSRRQLWEMAATDLSVPDWQARWARLTADALIEAYTNLRPALCSSGTTELTGITRNRRAGISTSLTRDSIDPQLGVIRIDSADGSPLAVLWNYAIHNVAWAEENLEFSADIAGAANAYIEQHLGAAALFTNGAEGDIEPIQLGQRGLTDAAVRLGQRVLDLRAMLTPTETVTMASRSQLRDFGPGHLSPLVIPAVIGASLPLGPAWLENEFRFQALRINDTLLLSVPGEPTMTLGQQLKAEARALGYERVFICALVNGHMGYVLTETEYAAGGYEALASFWDSGAAEQVRAVCRELAAVAR